jgi:hypothetical protein
MHGRDFVTSFGGEHNLTVTLGVEHDDDEPVADNSGTPILTVLGQYEADQDWIPMLAGIANERWPEGFTPNKPNDFLFDYYHPGLQALCRSAGQELTNTARRFIGLMRWRFDNPSLGAPDRIGWRSTEWSTDGQGWEPLHYRLYMTASLSQAQISLTPCRQLVVEDLASTDVDEPLGREIWHVAARSDDSRVRIILGVTAVEVELKRHVTELVPHVSWLATNAPSPPIVKWIKDYLPTLPGVDAQYLPPKRLRAIMETAITLRNDLVHAGSMRAVPKISPDDILVACSDLLWLLDVYRGHEWAAEHLSDQTRIDLGLDPQP